FTVPSSHLTRCPWNRKQPKAIRYESAAYRHANHRLCNRRFSWEISKMAALSINGQTHQVDVDPNTPLLWVLRDTIGLTGTKYGCGIAQCGACTVHVDGIAMRSCSVPLSAVAGRQITTIERLARCSAYPRRTGIFCCASFISSAAWGRPIPIRSR